MLLLRAVICSILCFVSDGPLFAAKKWGKTVRGIPPNAPDFWGAGSILHQKRKLFQVAAVRCQIHLTELRLTAHDADRNRLVGCCCRLTFQTMVRYDPAVSSTEHPATRRSYALHLVSGFGKNLRNVPFRGPTGALLKVASWWEQQLSNTFLPVTPRMSTQQKLGVRDQRGPGDLFTRPQAGAYGANRRKAAALRRSGVLFNRLKSHSPWGRNPLKTRAKHLGLRAEMPSSVPGCGIPPSSSAASYSPSFFTRSSAVCTTWATAWARP